MIHSTTADRAISKDGSILSADSHMGYTIKEVKLNEKSQPTSVLTGSGTSLYCVSGRGTASRPDGKVRYVLEPGVVITSPGGAGHLVIEATNNLHALIIEFVATHNPHSI